MCTFIHLLGKSAVNMMNLQSTKLLLQRSKIDVELIEKKKRKMSHLMMRAAASHANTPLVAIHYTDSY